MDRMKDKLDALWGEYREACPDPEPSAQFMPNLWQRIEARRTTSVFRRLTQVCVAATAALTIIMGVVLIPQLQKAPVYTSNYVDVLAAEHTNTYVDILNGDIR
jgi:negative regulator of sigma E activity